MGGGAWDIGTAVDAVLCGGAGEDVSVDQVATVLQLLGEHRDRVDRIEVAFLDTVLARGWTWEQLGIAMGKRSKQAAQQHAKRLRARLDSTTETDADTGCGVAVEVSVSAPAEVIPAKTAAPMADAPSAPPQQHEPPQQRPVLGVEEPAEVVVPVKWRPRGQRTPYTGPTRFDRTVPATSCPTCDFSPAGQSLRGRLREDLKVTWLEGDTDGGLVERVHCERCQPRPPRHRIADLSCVKCGEGPLLVDTFATAWADEHKIEPAVLEWLTAHGWREAAQGMVCGDHE